MQFNSCHGKKRSRSNAILVEESDNDEVLDSTDELEDNRNSNNYKASCQKSDKPYYKKRTIVIDEE